MSYETKRQCYSSSYAEYSLSSDRTKTFQLDRSTKCNELRQSKFSNRHANFCQECEKRGERDHVLGLLGFYNTTSHTVSQPSNMLSNDVTYHGSKSIKTCMDVKLESTCHHKQLP